MIVPHGIRRSTTTFAPRLIRAVRHALAQVDIINSLKLAGWYYCSLEKNEDEIPVGHTGVKNARRPRTPGAV